MTGRMDLRPEKGLKVVVNADREAVFGDESVGVQKVVLADRNRKGTMTGMVLAGFCEVEMQQLDGKRHWYPIENISGEKGEKIMEEQIVSDEELRAGDDEEAAE